MTKQTYKIHLEKEDKKNLDKKAEEGGFVGRGSLSHFLTKIAREPIVFLDMNSRKILSLINEKREG